MDLFVWAAGGAGARTAPNAGLDWFWLCRRASVLYLMYVEVGAVWWATLAEEGDRGGEGSGWQSSSDGTRPSV